MDRVHEGVHGLGPQGWCMDWGSMVCIQPNVARKQSSLNLSQPRCHYANQNYAAHKFCQSYKPQKTSARQLQPSLSKERTCTANSYAHINNFQSISLLHLHI